jgi:putative aldouronate transport system substrate-binding protein
MKKNLKLLFGTVLFLFLAAGAFAGGGQAARNRGSGTASIDRSNFNPLGQYPLVKNKETITVLIPTGGLEQNMDENWQTLWYEEKTNVHVNWQYAPSEQFKERVNLALASGEALDLVVGPPWNPTDFSRTEFLRLANQKVILPIQDLIASDTVNMKQNLASVQDWKEILTMPDGNIYSIPEMEAYISVAYYGKMFINKEFLKNVGITKIPGTPGEFKQMLIAFRDKDANGNGIPDDEIPLMGATGNYSYKIDTYLMSAFVYDDGLNRLYLNNKKVTAAFQQPEFREGLIYLNDLYKEGLISRDSFSASASTRGRINSQKYESVVGALPSDHHLSLGTREEGEPVRFIDYTTIPPLKGPHGLQVARYEPYSKFRNEHIGGMIPATCKNPALIMRYLDFWHTFEGSVITNFGGKGIAWDDADPGATGAAGGPAVFKTFSLTRDNPWYGKANWGQQWWCMRNSDWWDKWQQNPPLSPDGSGGEAFITQETIRSYQPYGNESLVVPPLWYSAEDASQIPLLATNINTYVEEGIAKFVVGDLDPNKQSDWDNFQAQLRSLGVTNYLQIIQRNYDSSPFAKK